MIRLVSETHCRLHLDSNASILNSCMRGCPMKCLCPQCLALLETQAISLHSGLVEINHNYNNTLYQCKDCGAQVGLASVPHRWELVAFEQKQHVA